MIHVRCKALFIFDHSSGHEMGDAEALNITRMNKGPDWAGKVPTMRDGWYLDSQGCRIS